MRTLLIAALFLPLPALAGEADRSPALAEARAAIADRDQDADARLTQAELRVGPRIFRFLDRDGDGFLTAEELAGGARRRKGPRAVAPDAPKAKGPDAKHLLERFDADHDGKLSRNEWPQDARLPFDRADRNRDGFVERAEIAELFRKSSRGADSQVLERLKQLDRNKDGRIDKQEWQAAPRPLPAELFERLDADHDGAISQKEIKKAAKGMRGRWRNRAGETILRRFDADQDGKGAREEWKLRPELFAKLDRDGDGFLTRKELSPRGPRRGRTGVDERSGKDSAHFLAKFDRNGDGQVTPDEFPHRRRFAEIDGDGNGALSQAEIEEAMDKRREEESYDIMERYDLNEDGRVTREEFTGPAAEFEHLDRNNDGVIDAADKR